MILPLACLAVGGTLVWAALRHDDVSKRQAALPPKRNPRALPPESQAATHRAPDRAAVINLPVDEEDFEQLEQAVRTCLEALAAVKPPGSTINADELRDCILRAIYPDFAWPPVPGDPRSAHLMYRVADHEAKKALANAHLAKGPRR